MNEPKPEAKPQIRIIFHMPGGVQTDLGRFYSNFEFKAMLNGGYIIRANLYDAHFNIQSRLIKDGYFKESRTRPVIVEFQIKRGPDAVAPDGATKVQYAILLSLQASGDGFDKANLEFIAMDPPSWYLNMGDAAGTVWKGRVDQVIRDVVKKYAPRVKVDVSKTIDSDQNRWWMMRQDPKTFISSLIDWSSSITRKKSQWIIASDGFKLSVREQADWVSRQRAYYRVLADQKSSTILNWEYLSDNALSVVQTKLLTQGATALSGNYLDRITDKSEKIVYVKDQRTSSKQIAKTTSEQSFTRPPDSSPPLSGWTSVASIPEIYSAGELGLRYDEYIDGRPRGMWMNMVNNLLRVKLEVLGHGIWSDCMGLGVDTLFLRWTQGLSNDFDNSEHWWMTGNWIVYGFHHKVSRRGWYTDLYCARYDYNSDAVKVGGSGN